VIWAVFAVLLAGCGGTTTTVVTTVTQTETVQPTVTQTVTYTPPPPPGPKSTMTGDGTYVVGSDILAGTYRSTGDSGCYWARLSSLSTNDIIDNNLSSGPQTVEIDPSDKAFLTKGSPSWQKVD
jgi:hypothetical protein